MKRLVTLGAVLGAIVLSGPACAQTGDSATLQALLAEVRQLRLTMEKSISIGPHVQLVLQRVQLQDQKVARISQQLEEVRKRIGEETSRQTHAAEVLARVEQELPAETDPQRRKQLEESQAGLKLEAARGVDQQLTAHESELASALRNEQAILSEFDSKLDALERQLETLAAGDAQAAKPR